MSAIRSAFCTLPAWTAATFLALCLSSAARADLLLDNGLTLSMDAGTVSTPLLLTVQVVNAPSTVAGWQTSLRVVPDGGSSGTLAFSAVGQPASDYLLGAIGYGITPALFTNTTANDQLLSYDYDSPAGGVTGVLHNVGAVLGLETLTFQASLSASGTFGLFAIDQPSFRTQWTPVNPAAIQFTNVPVNTTPVRLGTITVTAVPEPSAAAFGLLSLLGLAAVKFVPRRLGRRSAASN